MGTIVERSRKDGTPAFLAQIVIKRDGKIAHRENRTFDRRPAAANWIKKREKELSRPGGVEAAKVGKKTLGDAIDRYTKDSVKTIGRTKAQVLRSIKEYPIAEKQCEEITSADLLEFAQELGQQMQPQTVGNYMSHLAAVFAIARPAWGISLDPQVMKDCAVVAKRLGVTAKSKQRDRRPTLDELDKLMAYFERQARQYPESIPMHRIMAFAIFSTRRQEELTQLLWSDLDEAHRRILVRDMKHPGQKIGNDVWCDLPYPAIEIAQAMPKAGDRIFPFNHRTVSSRFTRACKYLAIDDLRFHDLRHDGISRLFEMGYQIPHAAGVSGHRSWSSLKRYTHIREKGDKYESWRWLGSVITE